MPMERAGGRRSVCARGGRSYEARGLPSKLKREVFPPNDLFGGHTRAVLALIEEIRRDAPARND